MRTQNIYMAHFRLQYTYNAMMCTFLDPKITLVPNRLTLWIYVDTSVTPTHTSLPTATTTTDTAAVECLNYCCTTAADDRFIVPLGASKHL